jgi:hypothetical protein
MQRVVSAGPLIELRFDCGDHFVQVWEVSNVQASSSGQFPDSLDRIQLGAVGRKVIQSEVGGVLPSALAKSDPPMLSKNDPGTLT